MNTIPLRPFVTIKLLLLCAAAVALVTGCDANGIYGSGRIRTENRPIGDFTTVEAHGTMEIEWSPGAPALAVTTDENLQRHLETYVNGRKLVMQTHDSLQPTRRIRVRITSSKLTAAALHGAVALHASQLTGQNFYLDGTGATSTTVEGNVNQLTASMTGASRLHAENLQTQTSELVIAGAGKADVVATERLRVAISGAGKVAYAGNPKSVDKRISGAGSVRSKD